MSSILLRLILRLIAGSAGIVAMGAAALHRKSAALAKRAKERISAMNGYSIAALEQECWDRDGREICETKEAGSGGAAKAAADNRSA